MKKFTFALMALLVFTFSLKAQQYVSTEPANRNVILEEFTGRNCTWCPDGHKIANQIMAAHPDRVWAINVHAGGFSPTTYPNLNTTDSETLRAGFGVSSFPSGVVNRSTASAIDRGQWSSQTNQQLNQLSECNIAGRVVVNPQTRLASITVEVYYTGSSSADENYLTVAMLQDSILGSQTGMSNNPAQVIGNQYCHMHILRDIITTSTWGEAISPTTQGTLITRTFAYEIPESIGNPNGVEVDINNVFFLAWVSERYQGTPTRPILTGCELELTQGTDEPIYPFIKSVAQQPGTTCTHTKIVDINVQNIGTETLTSLAFSAELEGETYTFNWQGEMEPFGTTKIELPVEVPFGTHNLNVSITDANGQPYQGFGIGSVNCMEWLDLQVEGETEQLKLELMQDKYGNQITWEFTASDGTVLGSGGPYSMLMGNTLTQLHIEYVTVPTNECVKFTIHDAVGNGICCTSGDGYYIVYDSQNNVVFGDQNDGDFGSEASELVSVMGAQGEVIVGETEVFYEEGTNADFCASLTCQGYPDEVGFVYRKVTSSTENTVVGFFNEFQKILATVDDLELSCVYMVKAYAIVNGQTYYGPEATFQTFPDGLNELESSLKLYPNPASSVLNVVGEGMTHVEIYNSVGQRVMTKEVGGNEAQINIESLNNGMYVVRIYANDGAMLNRTLSVVR